MFEKSLQQRFAQLFSGYNVRERGPFTCEQARKFIRESRHVRAHDYVYSFDVVNGVSEERSVMTEPKWFFILTNAAIYCDKTSGQVFPDVAITFPDAVGADVFGTSLELDGAAPSKAAIATEGWSRFEPYKNLFYVIGETVNMKVRIVPPSGTSFHGYMLLSGVEIDLNEEF